jgi:hypothetical protein
VVFLFFSFWAAGVFFLSFGAFLLGGRVFGVFWSARAQPDPTRRPAIWGLHPALLFF